MHIVDLGKKIEMEELSKINKTGNNKAVVQPITIENFHDIEKSGLFSAIQECDILCVCFGPFVQKPLDQTSALEWKQMALLNYALPGICVSTALPYMTAKKWGRIILMGGTRTQDINSFSTNAAYAGAKTGVGCLVKSVATEYASKGITCNGVMPGFTKTEYQSQQQLRELALKMPLGKLVAPETIARTIMFLISTPEINGALLPIDCGWHPCMTGKNRLTDTK